MSNDSSRLTQNPLFARKGDATPAPAVSYVGVTDLRGKLNRRKERSGYEGADRRQTVLDGIVGGSAPGTVEAVPEVAPPPAPAAEPAPPPPRAPAPSAVGGMMAGLIHRRGTPKAPPPAVAATPERRAPEGAPERRAPEPPASAPVPPASAPEPPASAQVEPPLAPPPPVPAAKAEVPKPAPALKPKPKRRRRRQLTVRLPVKDFDRLKALAKKTGHTYQDLLATAASDYLEESLDEAPAAPLRSEG